MYAKFDTDHAEAPNFAAHMQRQQDEQDQKSAETSSPKSLPAREQTFKSAVVEPPAIVHEEQRTETVGSQVKSAPAKAEQLANGTVHKKEETVAAAESVMVTPPKLETSPRYDVTGTEAEKEERLPCPSYAVTLSTVGHQPLDTWGQKVPCALDGFGAQLHVKNALPHLGPDGNPIPVEEEQKTSTGPGQVMEKLGQLMGAGMGVGVAPDTGSGPPNALKAVNQTVGLKNAGISTSEGGDKNDGVPIPAEEEQKTSTGPGQVMQKLGQLMGASMGDGPQQAIAAPPAEPTATAPKQTHPPVAPSAQDARAVANVPVQSFEDSLRGFRDSLRAANKESTNLTKPPKPASEDEFHNKLKFFSYNAAASLE